jgi:hypothetical protein
MSEQSKCLSPRKPDSKYRGKMITTTLVWGLISYWKARRLEWAVFRKKRSLPDNNTTWTHLIHGVLYLAESHPVFRRKYRFHRQNRWENRGKNQLESKLQKRKSWRWRLYVPPKRLLPFDGLYGVSYQKMEFFKRAAVTTRKPWNRPLLPVGLWNSEDPALPWKSAHRWQWGCQH